MKPDIDTTNPDADRSLSGFVTVVFTAWNSAGVRFVVLRNYDQLPEHVDNDIDILVSPEQRQLAELTLVAVAREAGYAVHNRAAFTPVSLFFHQGETLQQVQVDLFTSLGFRIFDVLPVNAAVDRRVAQNLFACPDPVDESIVNLVTRLLYQGYVKEKYRPAILKTFIESSDTARDRLASAFGGKHAAFVVDAVAAERWTAIEDRATSLRRALIGRRLLQQPLQTLGSAFKDASRLLRRWFQPPGLSVVLLGPDGCGKSTVGEKMIEKLRYSFSPDKGLQIHWKPVVFFRKRREHRAPTTNPHGKPPRGALLSILFLHYHWIEYFLGALLQISRVKFRNGLVVIDRHYYDFLVDPRRYRLNPPGWVVRLGATLLPNPDLVFVLDAPAEVLQSRKQEVPIEETQRQRSAFQSLARSLKNGHVIDASQPPDQVANLIVQTVLEHLTRRTAQRHGLGRTTPDASVEMR